MCNLEFNKIENCNNKGFYITINDIKILISYTSILGILDMDNNQLLLNDSVRKSNTTTKHINNFINMYYVDINKNYIKDKDFNILINYILRNDMKRFNKKCLKLLDKN